MTTITDHREQYDIARAELERALKSVEAGTLDEHILGPLTARLERARNDLETCLSVNPSQTDYISASRSVTPAQRGGRAMATSPGQLALRSLGATAGGDSGDTARGLAEAVSKSRFNLRSNPSVMLSGAAVFGAATKANVWAASTALNPSHASDVAPLGRDSRFLYPHLPSKNIGNETAISDFVQSVRSLTGTTERAIDATSTKANLDLTVVASTEAIKGFAVTINSVPNIVIESNEQLGEFLQSEGQFQVSKALDDHILAQIVASTPAFGNTGSTFIDKVRNAISAMRLLGANPNVLAVNPTDLAALDLFRVGGSTTTDGAYQIDVARGRNTELWGLTVVERVGGGTDPAYVIDTAMLGVLYVGSVRFDADPYSEFKKNLTTLRIELNGLFHIRNAQGARRIAAT